MHRNFFCFLMLLGLARPCLGANWPSWRGPHENGVCDEHDLPDSWSPVQNVRWKVALPEPGNSTPVVWGDRIFVTQSLDKGKRRAIFCFARADGKKLWQQGVPCLTEEKTHGDNPPCSSSPVTDGAAVYANFASGGVVAYDFSGRRLWHRDLGPLRHNFGNGSSPTLYKDLLILFHGPGEPTFMIALDKRIGKTVWKQDEHALNHNLFGTWSSPILARIGGHDELLMSLPGERVGGDGWVKSYDPANGKELWRCVGLGASLYPSPVLSKEGDVIVGASGFYGPVLAVRTGGRGDVTATHRLWHKHAKNPQRVGTAVVTGGYVYLADADGFVECLKAGTGEQVWKERLGGKLWGSMLLADNKLYVSNLEGTTYVLAASQKFQRLATNTLDEPTYAGLAVSDGAIFLRTWKNLFTGRGGPLRQRHPSDFCRLQAFGTQFDSVQRRPGDPNNSRLLAANLCRIGSYL
jgi:outer membrane protein assembly factor BamB